MNLTPATLPPRRAPGRARGARDVLPAIDMTDSGFRWTVEELEEATRTAMEWLFPINEEET